MKTEKILCHPLLLAYVHIELLTEPCQRAKPSLLLCKAFFSSTVENQNLQFLHSLIQKGDTFKKTKENNLIERGMQKIGSHNTGFASVFMKNRATFES